MLAAWAPLMLEFTDNPYRFYPPRPSWAVIHITRFLNRTVVLPNRNHRIRGVGVENRERVEALRKDRDVRLLFVANHSTHSDPQILAEAQRQCGVVSSFMAAYEVFQRGRVQAWVMQHSGAFSVDRDSSDRESLKTAVGVLTEGRYPLTIFPEGNVYFTNDRPAPFLEGAAFIAHKAQREIGGKASVVVVPVSIKVTHLTDQREAIRQRLEAIAEALGTAVDPGVPLLDEFRRIGLLALERNVIQRGLEPRKEAASLVETVGGSAERIIEDLETKTGISPKPGLDLTGRIRRIRSTIHQVRSDPDRAIDHPVAAVWADEAMLAIRLLGYTRPYLEESPTLDRFGETTERFNEDVYSRMFEPYADRFAFVRINAPIHLSELIPEAGMSSWKGVERIHGALESAVQQGLDEINARNPHPGGESF